MIEINSLICMSTIEAFQSLYHSRNFETKLLLLDKFAHLIIILLTVAIMNNKEQSNNEKHINSYNAKDEYISLILLTKLEKKIIHYKF